VGFKLILLRKSEERPSILSCCVIFWQQGFPFLFRFSFTAVLRLSACALFGMIHFILLQNRQGKTRLSKWYSPFEHNEKIQLQDEVHRLIVKRNRKYTNFIEFRQYKIVYRRYAGLYFSYCVDVNDNPLAYLESIHLFVELLDKFFNSVCELDLVYNFHKIYAIVDEIYLGGEIQETSKRVILDRIEKLEKLE